MTADTKESKTLFAGLLRPYVIVRDPNAPRKTYAIAPHINARSFWPPDLASIYNAPPVVAALDAPRTKIVIVSFGGGLYGTVDSNGMVTGGDCEPYWQLPELKQNQGSNNPSPTIQLVLIGGAQNLPGTDSASFENHLDVQFVGGIAPASDIVLIIGPNTMNGMEQVFAKAEEIAPYAVSTSWGLPETAAPLIYVNAINERLRRLAALGITVFAATGDQGSGDGLPGQNVDFPASSPYTVACGGTSLLSATNTYDANTTREVVWNNNSTSSATGGGTSVIYARPSWQPLNGLYRTLPDVDSVADPDTGIYMRLNGTIYTVGGTSAASPVLAGLAARMRVGNTPPRFLAPLFYACPNSCFHDIISGNNGAHTAGPGYDLASGIGSINATLIAEAIAGGDLPPPPPPPPPPTAVIALSQTTLVFTGRRSQQVKAIITLTNKSAPGSWSTSDANIATASSNGVVLSKNNGTCNIIFTPAASDILPLTIVVTVAIPVPVSSLILQTIVHVGQTIDQLFYLAKLPMNTTETNFIWTSSMPSIATVNASTGAITGVAVGSTTIHVTNQNGRRTATSTICVV